MQILNIHERELKAPAVQVGALIDTLASAGDRLWPRHSWPHMQFDRPLGVGADGGHGPIRYRVEAMIPADMSGFVLPAPKASTATMPSKS